MKAMIPAAGCAILKNREDTEEGAQAGGPAAVEQGAADTEAKASQSAGKCMSS